MTLNLIGLGLNDEKDITLKGLELVKKAGKQWRSMSDSEKQKYN